MRRRPPISTRNVPTLPLHDALPISSLRQRYARREMMGVDPNAMAALDRSFYASWPEIGVGRFIGFDASEPAIRYANAAGLHLDGVVANLDRKSTRLNSSH